VEQFCSDLRRLQQRRKCTDSVCADIVLTLGKYLKVDLKNFRKNDKKMQEAAGVKFLRLNGCIGCHNFVYLPDDARTHCPQVLESGTVCGKPRFNAAGKAHEVLYFVVKLLIERCLHELFILLSVYIYLHACSFCHCTQRVLYFPIKPRLDKLLQIPKYFQMCQHEYVRPRNPELITDVYDGDAWKELMGPPTSPVKRIGLCYCIDSFPANKEGSISVKPGGLMNVSLPPAQRAKPENMLIIIVIPTDIKDFAQRKYYEFMATYELNELFHEGWLLSSSSVSSLDYTTPYISFH